MLIFWLLILSFFKNSVLGDLDHANLVNLDNLPQIEFNTKSSDHYVGQQVNLSISIKDTSLNFSNYFIVLVRCSNEDNKCLKIVKCDVCGKFIVNKSDNNFKLNLATYSTGRLTFYLESDNSTISPILKNYFIDISIAYSKSLNYLSIICGWIYFTAWSISFYPQIILNFQRKSVYGFHFDFLALNTTGFLFYSIYNLCLYFSKYVQDTYFKMNPYSLIPVELNDVFFSVHATLTCLVVVIQCFIYERENQRISKVSASILGFFWLTAIFFTILMVYTEFNIIYYLNILSYIKLCITFIKYIPQAYYNYKRQSTIGWSIQGILLDLTGGLFSLLQIILINFNYDNWQNIKGNLTKFGLGFFSIFFDFLFMWQHFVLYRQRESLFVTNSNDDLNQS